jgi:hypothetical protein
MVLKVWSHTMILCPIFNMIFSFDALSTKIALWELKSRIKTLFQNHWRHISIQQSDEYHIVCKEKEIKNCSNIKWKDGQCEDFPIWLTYAESFGQKIISCESTFNLSVWSKPNKSVSIYTGLTVHTCKIVTHISCFPIVYNLIFYYI